MDLAELLRMVGLSGFIIVAATKLTYKIADRESERRLRESELRAEDVRSRLDDTETLRTISKEDRLWLQKAQERNEILHEANIKMLREIIEYQSKLTEMTEELENSNERCAERQQMLEDKVESLESRCTDLESQLKAKEVIIQKYREK